MWCSGCWCYIEPNCNISAQSSPFAPSSPSASSVFLCFTFYWSTCLVFNEVFMFMFARKVNLQYKSDTAPNVLNMSLFNLFDFVNKGDLFQKKFVKLVFPILCCGVRGNVKCKYKLVGFKCLSNWYSFICLNFDVVADPS